MKSVLLLAISFLLCLPLSFAQRVNNNTTGRRDDKHFTRKPTLPQTVKKQRYRIDVLANVYLDDVVLQGKSVYANKIQDKTQTGLSFYEGVKLAVDQLNNQGYKMDVYFHDISSAGQSISNLLSNPGFQQTDLLIGAVQGNDIKTLANFAQNKKINFISAISPSDAGVTANPFFTVLQPTLNTHVQYLGATILKNYPGQHIPLLTLSSKALDKTATNILMEKYGDKFIQFNAGDMNIHKWTNHFDSNRVNPIIATIMEGGDADKVLNYLNTNYPNYQFDVYGMPTWKFLKGIKKLGFYPNIKVNYTSPFYFEANTGAGATLLASYVKTFGNSYPGEMVYRGYESLYWFAYLLNKYGTIFNQELNDNAAAYFTRFDIKANYDDDGIYLFQENKNLYLYQYSNGNFQIEN